MTILEKMKTDNTTVIEKKINEQYVVWAQGLDKLGCATDNAEEVDHVIVQLNGKIWVNEYDFIQDLVVEENMQWEAINEEFVQKQVGFSI